MHNASSLEDSYISSGQRSAHLFFEPSVYVAKQNDQLAWWQGDWHYQTASLNTVKIFMSCVFAVVHVPAK